MVYISQSYCHPMIESSSSLGDHIRLHHHSSLGLLHRQQAVYLGGSGTPYEAVHAAGVPRSDPERSLKGAAPGVSRLPQHNLHLLRQ